MTTKDKAILKGYLKEFAFVTIAIILTTLTAILLWNYLIMSIVVVPFVSSIKMVLIVFLLRVFVNFFNAINKKGG